MDYKKNIGVIGGGCGGQAIAGYLASQGHNIKLYNRSPFRLGDLPSNPRIHLSGHVEAEGELAGAYHGEEIGNAVVGNDLIMVVTNSLGHRAIAHKIAPYLSAGQTIVLNPGRTLGGLEFISALHEEGCKADVNLVEANTLIYATRTLSPGNSYIYGVKDSVAISVFPKCRQNEIVSELENLYPQFYPVDSFLETSLGNIGSIFHPSILLGNKKRVIAGEEFDFYIDGVTSEVADFMQQVDQEKLAVAGAMGIEVQSIEEWLCERYGLNPELNLMELLHSNPYYKGIKAPNTLDNRYIWEDIPAGLVPLSELGNAVGVETQGIDHLIDEASSVMDCDMRSIGRTLYSLGIPENDVPGFFSRLAKMQSINELEYPIQKVA